MRINAILFAVIFCAQSFGANLYVRSTDGNDGDSGATWALAKATIAGALTAASAGDTVFVSDNHSESSGSTITLTSPGTAASPVRILCGDDAAEPPTALATTAVAATTGTSGFAFNGFAYCYGVKFTAGNDSGAVGVAYSFVSTSAWYWKFDTCVFDNGSNATTVMLVGAGSGQDDQLLELENIQFNGIAGGMYLELRVDSGRLIWRNSPNAFPDHGVGFSFTLSGDTPRGYVSCSGVNFDGASSDPAYLVATNAQGGVFRFHDCKVPGGGFAFTSGAIPGQGGIDFVATNCDSADTNYRYYKQAYQGVITQESTIVRTSGATDGTTPISRKMVSSANAKFYSPLESDPIVFWNESTSSTTITVPVITDNVTLTDAEAWIEVEYLGTSGFPLSLNSSDRAATILATPANQTTDGSSTWTTTGLTTPVKQSLSVTFTPAEKGLIRARVMLAKASTTMYFDPLIAAAGGREFMVGESGYMNEGGGGSGIFGGLVK